MATNKRFDIISDIGCVACIKLGFYGTPPQIHHLKGSDYCGYGQKADDEDTIGLCIHHHLGPEGYHSDPKGFTERFGTQTELLEHQNKLLKMRGYDADKSNPEKRQSTT